MSISLKSELLSELGFSAEDAMKEAAETLLKNKGFQHIFTKLQVDAISLIAAHIAVKLLIDYNDMDIHYNAPESGYSSD